MVVKRKEVRREHHHQKKNKVREFFNVFGHFASYILTPLWASC